MAYSLGTVWSKDWSKEPPLLPLSPSSISSTKSSSRIQITDQQPVKKLASTRRYSSSSSSSRSDSSRSRSRSRSPSGYRGKKRKREDFIPISGSKKQSKNSKRKQRKKQNKLQSKLSFTNSVSDPSLIAKRKERFHVGSIPDPRLVLASTRWKKVLTWRMLLRSLEHAMIWRRNI